MMRGLVRNKRDFYYALYERKEEIEDEYGNKTGEYAVVYSKPIKCKGNISAAQGEIQNRQFGDSESYDKVITLCDVNIPIDEYSILWVDNLPIINDDGSTDTPHDYIIKANARSLNVVSLAISKVNVR
jgi:hypothetical protein